MLLIINYLKAPATGPASKADTIIHEGTHFPQVIGWVKIALVQGYSTWLTCLYSTEDYAYGESDSLSLARSNPTNAVYNAE